MTYQRAMIFIIPVTQAKIEGMDDAVRNVNLGLEFEPDVDYRTGTCVVRADQIESFSNTEITDHNGDMDEDFLPATAIQMMSGDMLVANIPFDEFIDVYIEGESYDFTKRESL